MAGAVGRAKKKTVVPAPEPAPDAEPRVPPVDLRVSFQVHRVNAKLAQVANRLFRAQSLDLISSRILVFLLERGEMRVGDLVELMVLPQSTISHQLQRLDRRKLLRRRRMREDNRSVAVVLTPLGQQVAQACNDLSTDVYRSLVEDLSEQDLAQLTGLLGRMFSALVEYDREQRSRAVP